jgi:succinate dehydrogenase / fumarate reductase, cytochrome b subunit
MHRPAAPTRRGGEGFPHIGRRQCLVRDKRQRGPLLLPPGPRAFPERIARHANVGIALASPICLNRPDRSDRLIRLKIMAEAKSPVARPLSPHLQIYRLTLTMAMSIVHRITGAALYVGTPLLAWWLLAAASGPNAYATFQAVASSLIGRLVLFGYTWALIHHMLGGIRHLIWDTGHGFAPAEREWLVRANLAGSIVLTVLLWIIGGVLMGGLR